MTFSILAWDARTGAIGGAAATGNLCVGGWVLRARAGVGASASQGKSPSTLWGEQALEYLQRGMGAEEALDAITGADPGRDHRQLAILDAHGHVAGWTGEENEIARGHLPGDGYIVSGNWLTDVGVLREMERVYNDMRADQGTSFAKCLLGSLAAGVAAGSDARGTLSTALKIFQDNAPPLDLRIDHDPDPMNRLLQLFERSVSRPYVEWISTVPTITAPHRF